MRCQIPPGIVEPDPSPAPTTCFDRKWHKSGGMCTNGFQSTSNDDGNALYNNMVECCDVEFSDGKCRYEDICFDLTVTEWPTPSPTDQGTFGSTPTVSKETTGPPTKAADRVEER